MKENVGPTDQAMRAIVGPLLLAAGYWRGGREGRTGGLLAMLTGALVTQTAITRTCPLNQAFGIDTTRTGGELGGRPVAFPRRFGARRGAISKQAAEETEPGTAAGERAEKLGRPIEYSNFINAASSLTFIRDEAQAEAAVKAVLGILASRLEEREARRLVASLPDPLSLESLRGHQASVADLSVEQYYGSLAKQFQISTDQAQVLAVTILRLVKEALDFEGMRDIERSLPGEWTDLIERV